MIVIAFLASLLAVPEESSFCDLSSNYLEQIREQRLAGELDEARDAARSTLECFLPGDERVALLIELAKIEDRIGLHQNTRPVAEALEAIKAADVLAAELGATSKAAVALAKADYFYRAEMSERQFVEAERFGNEALQLFEELNDKHGAADAVHRLGLIHFQRRAADPENELALARVLYDRSLALDEAGGARPWFCGEYGRHVGFIYNVQEDYETALPHFERSLACRKEARAIDAALFAAETLGSTLLRLERAEEARAPLLYGLVVAEDIGSPIGTARVARTLGAMYEALEDDTGALAAYGVAAAAARSAQSVGLAQAVCDRMEALGGVCD